MRVGTCKGTDHVPCTVRAVFDHDGYMALEALIYGEKRKIGIEYVDLDLEIEEELRDKAFVAPGEMIRQVHLDSFVRSKRGGAYYLGGMLWIP